MAQLGEFRDTKISLQESINWRGPLSYEEWRALPTFGHKVGALYVQFYDQIAAAWTKANTSPDGFFDPEEGVTTIMQYLMKNAQIIENDGKRFTPAYIYTVAYRCLYCICHDKKCSKDRFENETSAIVATGDGEEFDLLSSVASKQGSCEDVYHADKFREEFWTVIKSFGPEAEKVMNYLLYGDVKQLKKARKGTKSYDADDPLNDVEVSLERAEELIARIREKLLDLSVDSECGNYISRFRELGESNRYVLCEP